MRDPLEETRLEPKRTLAVVLGFAVALAAIGVANPTALGVIGIWVGIILMIMIHEGGHYLTAKWSDMKVTEYFLGFGPRVWSFRRGETEYGVKAIPAGGYVRIVGMHNLEEVEPNDEPRTYRSKPYHRRLIVVTAGVITHFVIAGVLFFVVLTVFGLPETSPVISELVEDAPAAAAGFEVGDRILAVDGLPVDEWDDVPGLVQPRAGERLVVTVERAGRTLDVPVTPAARETEDGGKAGFLGIAPRVDEVTRPPLTAARETVVGLGRGTKQVVLTFGRFFTPSSLERYGDALTGKERADDEKRFLSPVGATQVAIQRVDSGLPAVLEFLATINLVVGTLNLLPLPPLDGGHVAVATYEKIASMIKGERVQVDMAKILPVALVVVMVFLFIGISALWLDIFQPADAGF